MRRSGFAKTIGDVSAEAGRGPGQRGWYEFAAEFARGKTVLDAGCGLGYGLDILAKVAKEVRGQDLDPRLATRREITIQALDKVPANSFDVVTSIDVIEHVEHDEDFVRQLTRIAREAVFLSTPNWTVTRCSWPYHIREYTPRELLALLSSFGDVILFKGDPAGSMVFRVTRCGAYNFLNDLRTWRVTGFPTRCANHILPLAARLHSHSAALIRLRSPEIVGRYQQ